MNLQLHKKYFLLFIAYLVALGLFLSELKKKKKKKKKRRKTLCSKIKIYLLMALKIFINTGLYEYVYISNHFSIIRNHILSISFFFHFFSQSFPQKELFIFFLKRGFGYVFVYK